LRYNAQFTAKIAGAWDRPTACACRRRGICSEAPRSSRNNACYVWYHFDINIIRLVKYFYLTHTVK
jgi:hypothetical protein